MKLSICMMVKNEEKNLRRCLGKLKPLTESGLAELIIIDTGSEDQTEKIAKQYTNKVYFHKWNKNFSEMRNISMSYASGEWIFIIDADERLDDVEKLITIMNSSEIKKFNTILLQVKNLYYAEDESKYNLITSPRVFKNDGKFRYEGAVHNQPMFNGPNLSVDISLTHFGYITNDKDLMEAKYKRTTELLKAELQKEPENIYYIYQLGVSYDMHGDYKEALSEFRRAYKILNKRSLEEKRIYVYVYASYSRIAYTNGELKETIRIAKEALGFEKNYIDLYYLLGISESKLRNDEDAFEYFNKYIDLVSRYNELEISKDMSIIMYHIDDNSKSTAYFQIFKYYLDLEKYKDAYRILSNITSVSEKIYACINILIPLGKYLELREVYNNIKLEIDKNNFLCTLEEKIKEINCDEKKYLYKEFGLNECAYGTFSKIKISSDMDEKVSLTKKIIDQVDFNKQPVFYSEIFKNIKDDIKLIIDVLKKIEICKLKDIVKFLIEQNEFVEVFENYILKKCEDVEELEETKAFIAISDILMLVYIKNNDKVSEKYLNIFKAYINIGMAYIQKLYRVEMAEDIYKYISNQEDRFFVIMYVFNKLIKENNKKTAIKYMIKAVKTYEAFAKYIDVYKDEILNLGEKAIIQEKNKQFEDYKLKVKENINNLINQGSLEEAKKLISEYDEIVNQDLEIYSMKAIIYIMENQIKDAESILKSGLEIDENNFDLTYNLAYVYEQSGEFSRAIELYIKAENYCNDYNVKQEINGIVNKIKQENPNLIIKSRKKIVFFVKQGMDSFLGDIIDGISQEYETKKIIVTNYNQINDGMEWADICWFEWCDELIVYGSQYVLANQKKIICRIHGYEVYSNFIKNVNWRNVDNIIIVAPHIKRLFEENTKDIDKGNVQTDLIFCGVNTEAYPLNIKKKGFNLGYLGYVNFKKNIPLTLEIFKKLHDIDRRYKLYIAGEFQDNRTFSYLKYFIREHNLMGSVQFDGWQNFEQKVQWFKKIDYMLISSIDEGLCFAAAEAMSSGIKSVLHNCEGIKDHYDKKYIFNDIDEAVKMICENDYNSEEYRAFIENRYSLDKELNAVNKIIKKLIEKEVSK